MRVSKPGFTGGEMSVQKGDELLKQGKMSKGGLNNKPTGERPPKPPSQKIQKSIEEIKEEIDDILYQVYVECGDTQYVNEHGFNQGHYLVEDICKRIEEYFKKL